MYADGSFCGSEIYADVSFYDFVRVRFPVLRYTRKARFTALCVARFAVWCGGLIGEVGSHTRTLHIGRRNYFRR